MFFGHSADGLEFDDQSILDKDIRKILPKHCPVLIEDLQWMPPSCAYRRLHEGKTLPAWHPLKTGDPDSTHKAGVSVRNQTISETVLRHEEDALDFPAEDLTRDRGDEPYPAK